MRSVGRAGDRTRTRDHLLGSRMRCETGEGRTSRNGGSNVQRTASSLPPSVRDLPRPCGALRPGIRQPAGRGCIMASDVAAELPRLDRFQRSDLPGAARDHPDELVLLIYEGPAALDHLAASAPAVHGSYRKAAKPSTESPLVAAVRAPVQCLRQITNGGAREQMVKTLFHEDGWLSEWLRRRSQEAENAVHSIAADVVLNTPEPDLVESVYDQFAVKPLRLGTAYTRGPQDVQVDVGGQFLRGTEGRRGGDIPGTRVEVRVPYTGDPDLWDLRASQGTTLHPEGEIRGTELVLLFDEPADTLQPDTFGSRIQSLLTNIERYVGFAATDCEQFNSELRPRLVAAATVRKQKVLTDRKITEFLPVDVRPRASTDPAIAVALPPRRKAPVAPVSSTVPYVPEPAISAEQYAGILQAIRDWGLAVERLPETFGPLPEEALRDNLLASLNGQFGVSGAEWFSRKGKTDILIQQADGAVFIAECKFWDGPRAFVAAVDQLLG